MYLNDISDIRCDFICVANHHINHFKLALPILITARFQNIHWSSLISVKLLNILRFMYFNKSHISSQYNIRYDSLQRSPGEVVVVLSERVVLDVEIWVFSLFCCSPCVVSPVPRPDWSCTVRSVAISRLLQSHYRLLASLGRSASLQRYPVLRYYSGQDGRREVLLDITAHWLVQTVGGTGRWWLVKGQSRGYDSLSISILTVVGKEIQSKDYICDLQNHHYYY